MNFTSCCVLEFKINRTICCILEKICLKLLLGIIIVRFCGVLIVKLLKNFNKTELNEQLLKLKQTYSNFKQKNLNLNLSRGKPSPRQLDLSNSMLECLNLNELLKTSSNLDPRNYGLLGGTLEAKKFFARILNMPPEQIIVGGNSSLKLMFDCVSHAMNFGFLNNTPWHKLEKVKFLCPSPGYDRHFAICEQFNIEMIEVKMCDDGPDMSQVESLVQSDDSIKGIWCVPKYSNPTGVTYSDDVVRAFAKLKPAAPDFRIFWDNAYIIHHLTEKHDELLNIFSECEKYGNENMVLEFTSTSKITFPGGGISAIAASKSNVENILSVLSKQTIGYNKINQLIHCRFFPTFDRLESHMKEHAKIMKPKFDLVLNKLEANLKPLGIGKWTNPNGGYFISFNSPKNCATKIFDLCKQAGLILTDVGATFPYFNDKDDTNIRIAPSFPSIEELNVAMDLFCVCVKIASIENLLIGGGDINV